MFNVQYAGITFKVSSIKQAINFFMMKGGHKKAALADLIYSTSIKIISNQTTASALLRDIKVVANHINSTGALSPFPAPALRLIEGDCEVS